MAKKANNRTDFGFENGDATPFSHFKPTPHSGGPSDEPHKARLASGTFPRPTVETKKAKKPHGLEQPGTIGISGPAGPDTDAPKERVEGTGIAYKAREKSFTPEMKTAPTPHGLDMPAPVRHSDHTVRTSSLGAKPLKWSDRNYSKRTGQTAGPEPTNK
jgi:hypothetical protein